jgi:outer membrane protein OmpA-like peptidoglycan-associated protein
MKKTLTILAAALLCAAAPVALAQTVESGSVSADNVKFYKSGDDLVVQMDINTSGLDIKGSRSVVITPEVTDGTNSEALSSVGLYGRKRYIYYIRNEQDRLSSLSNDKVIRSKDAPEVIPYTAVVPFQPWMENAALKLNVKEKGCANCDKGSDDGTLANGPEMPVAPVYKPEVAYVTPQAEEVKARSLEGSAFINFEVNKTVIKPDYMTNPTELGKIIATIDSVKNDADVQVKSISIKGFASPEGKWANNERLAKGRTAALKAYINNLYKFDNDLISTSYEVEDWAGLKAFVEGSNLANKGGILDIINETGDADRKEAKIKSKYPEQYKFLLQTVYPSLRHSDYVINYVISNFTDPKAIRELVKTAPQKLSLNEFFIAAQDCEPGSEEFVDIFETAVRMYPDSEVANLNAASSELSHGDLANAEKHLAKAGDSPEAQFARGTLAALQQDYNGAAGAFYALLAEPENLSDALKAKIEDSLRQIKEHFLK